MSDEPNLEADRIAAYLAGDQTPAERAELETWLRQDPARQALAGRVGAVWTRIEPNTSTVDVNAMIARVSATIGVPLASNAPRNERLTGHIVRHGSGWNGSRWTGIFVGAGLVACAIVALMVTTRRASTDRIPSPSHVYATAAGQQASVTLPDGSRVRLAPESRLTLDARFGAETRTATLTGEAYFDVATGPRAPFIVRAAGTSIRVLGTSFDLRRYAADPATHVAVTTGKIALGNASHTATVPAGHLALAGDSSGITVTTGDPSISSAWIDGQLIFDDTPVRTMLATVGRWYDYDFRLADSVLALRHVGATFRIGESAKTLSAIADLLDVRVTVTGRVVTLTPRRQSSNALPASVPTFRNSRDSFSLSHEVGK